MRKREKAIVRRLRRSGLKTGDTVVIAKGTKYESKVTIVDAKPKKGAPK